MKILLVDADSTIPNLALMKLSNYYKTKFWANVKLLKLNISYYPDRVKTEHVINADGFDLVFCSVIFESSLNYIKGCNINLGGPAVKPFVSLPEAVEKCLPDYSLYSEEFVNKTSIEYISRGCIRNCEFCKVPKLEGDLKQILSIEQVLDRFERSGNKFIKFLDNNFLALSNHKQLLQELVESKVKLQFNQGLDIRLLDFENSSLLSKLNYFGEYVFAFDNILHLNLIENKLNFLNWRKPFQLKFFVYVHPLMPLRDTVKRIVWLKDNCFLPYIMRDSSCWSSKYNQFYVDIAAYCNQVFAFKKLTFEQFLFKRHKNKFRIEESLNLWKGCL